MSNTTYSWYRNSPMVPQDGPQTWTLRTEAGPVAESEVHVRYGKSIDYEAIKKGTTIKDELEHTAKFREHFERLNDFVPVSACPVCGTPTGMAAPEVAIWGNQYLNCPSCSHVFLDHFPSNEALQAFYVGHAVEDDYYTQKEDIDLRIAEIYGPKFDWIVQAYTRCYGRAPKTLLEIGSGAGHFLHYARQQGLEVVGFEYDETYRKWCMENFGITTYAKETDLPDRQFDVVASFNVIEHCLDVKAFLNLHTEHMGPQSLAVCETPKFHSLTTAMQRLHPEVVRGYLLPYLHNQMFSEASLGTLLHLNGLRVREAWYFGQDIVEILSQTLHHSNIKDRIKGLNDLMDTVQPAIDAGHMSDLMIFAATPV